MAAAAVAATPPAAALGAVALCGASTDGTSTGGAWPLLTGLITVSARTGLLVSVEDGVARPVGAA